MVLRTKVYVDYHFESCCNNPSRRLSYVITRLSSIFTVVCPWIFMDLLTEVQQNKCSSVVVNFK